MPPRRVSVPESAIVLAAGRGKRMGALTDARPKPLITVEGRALIDHVLDHLATAGVKRVVVNLHYMGDAIAAHLVRRRDIAVEFSREDQALETGGGIAKALPLLGDVFFALNADIFWLGGAMSALHQLAAGFDPARDDALLLMQPTARAAGYDGPGDFMLDPAGIVRRRLETEVAPFVFAGIEIVHHRLFDGAPTGAFSINRLWDAAIERGRLRGLVHDGEWYHVGTPESLALAEARLHTHRVER
ncbi:MAG: nucleotidyltransferase family protein [Alphaproteobacteria bacterium]|nr:nucleotidyltransferase family protein [Alphaproteobacteria bacterium]